MCEKGDVFCSAGRVTLRASVSFLNAVYEGEKLAWNAKDVSGCGFYLTRYKVAHCELREVLLPGGGSSSSLCGWSDMNAACWLLMNIHQLCVCVEGFIACHCSLILGIRERRQLLCLVSDVGQGKTPHPGSLEGPRLVGPEREPCTAQRIPNRECPRTSKRRKIKRNPGQAVNIVLRRLLFSSPKFMASVPALPISHHSSGPA